MSRAPFQYPPRPPRGMTLVEVLMSMLVTGIGVLSVVTLLPLAFIRSVQATNLTNSTILRYNAESQIDGDLTDLAYIYPFWTPNTNYPANQIIVPSRSSINQGLANNHYFQAGAAAATSGGAEPIWVIGGPTTDGTETWTDLGALDHYVIDPIGALVSGSPTLGTNVPAGLPAGRQPIKRFGGAPNGGNLGSITAAALLATLPDSWIEQGRGPVTMTPPPTPSATFTGIDLSGVGFTSPVPPALDAVISRIVFLDAAGKNSQTRIVSGITTTTAGGVTSSTINWLPNDPLPSGYVPIQARVETNDRRYTWMLTVRRDSTGQASVDVTVFFRRPLVTDDEQVYSTSGADGVVVPFTVTYGGGLPKPFAKKGGFLFDISFGRWYRIINIVNDTGTQFDAYVDHQRPQSEAIVSPQFGVVFMRSVVDFYSVGKKT
jgi:prepilin-type N-terminal cleavage/methylation domain-containing protein